jgi:hypothetical protein
MYCVLCKLELPITEIDQHVREEHSDQLSAELVNLLPFMQVASFRDCAGNYALNFSKFEMFDFTQIRTFLSRTLEQAALIYGSPFTVCVKYAILFSKEHDNEFKLSEYWFSSANFLVFRSTLEGDVNELIDAIERNIVNFNSIGSGSNLEYITTMHLHFLKRSTLNLGAY